MELYCRNLTKTYSDVRIVSGPLWLPEKTREPVVLEDVNQEKGGGDGGKAKKKWKVPKVMKYPVSTLRIKMTPLLLN